MSSLRIYLDKLLDGASAKVPRQELTHVERLALVRRHGDFSLAYSTAVQQKLSYFGDADAQYRLGCMLLEGQGGPKDPRQAARVPRPFRPPAGRGLRSRND